MKVVVKILIVLLITFILCLIGLYFRIKIYSTPTKGVKIHTYQNPKSALLVVDIQEDFTGKTARPPFPYKDSDQFIANVNNIINSAIDKGMIVIYVRQVFENNLLDLPLSKGRVIRGQEGAQVDSRVKLVNLNIFEKEKSDAFSNTEFEDFLIKNQINTLYIVGIDATACVYKTAKGAKNRNCNVTVIRDGILTMNMDKMDEILKKYKEDNISVIMSSNFTNVR